MRRTDWQAGRQAGRRRSTHPSIHQSIRRLPQGEDRLGGAHTRHGELARVHGDRQVSLTRFVSPPDTGRREGVDGYILTSFSRTANAPDNEEQQALCRLTLSKTTIILCSKSRVLKDHPVPSQPNYRECGARQRKVGKGRRAGGECPKDLLLPPAPRPPFTS